MKQFNTTLNGYDKSEVNAFVEEVTKEYESILHLKEKKDKLNEILKDVPNDIKSKIEKLM